jgi:DNA-binding LytR/AlgR family response regulator
MPKILGIDILKHAKEKSPGSIRILLTGTADLNTAVSAINEGHIFYYFSKPWKNDELKSVVRKALEQKREQDERNAVFEIMKHNKDELLEFTSKLSQISGLMGSHTEPEEKSAKKDSYNKSRNQGIEKISVYSDDNLILVDISDILYFYTIDGVVKVVTKNEAYKTRESLSYWEERLKDNNFFRCHRSYIINIDYVEKITPWFNGAYNIKLRSSNENIPVSRNYIKEFRSILNF